MSDETVVAKNHVLFAGNIELYRQIVKKSSVSIVWFEFDCAEENI